MSADPQKASLVAELDEARNELSSEYRSMVSIGESLDPRDRVLQSIRDRPLVWTLGALAVGFAASSLVGRRRRETVVESGAGLVSALTRTAIEAARPMVTRKVKEEAERFLQAKRGDRRTSEEPDHSSMS